MKTKSSNGVRLLVACGIFLALSMPWPTVASSQSHVASNGSDDIEADVIKATAAAAATATAAQEPQKQEESYQRVYEAFTKLMDNVSNNSLGNVRRLVSRLNQLVGGQPAADGISPSSGGSPLSPAGSGASSKRDQASKSGGGGGGGGGVSEEERTELILARLDRVNKTTDQNTLRQLNEDVSKLVGTLSDSYLRNIRRVIERVNRVVGRPSPSSSSSSSPELNAPPTKDAPSSVGLNDHQQQQQQQLHQAGDRFNEDPNKQPGFPGWDELIVAMDRVQKSLASFVRSSTKLITAGRRR